MTSLVKAAIKNSDNVSSVYRGISNVAGSALDIGSSLGKMNFSSLISASKRVLPALDASSGLIDTGKHVKKLAGAVPSSTDDLLTSINPSVAKKTTSLSSVDNLDAMDISNLNSLKKLDDAASQIKNTKKLDGLKGLSRRSEGALSNSDNLRSLSRATPPVNKVDDVGDVLKKSDGVLSKVDDVVESGAGILNKSAKKIDDVAEGAGKLSKTRKAAKFMSKYGAVISVGVMAAYYLGMHLAGGSDGEGGSNYDIADDPGSDLYPVSKHDEVSGVVVEDEITLLETLQRKEVVAVMIIAMVVAATL